MENALMMDMRQRVIYIWMFLCYAQMEDWFEIKFLYSIRDIFKIKE